MPIIRSQVRLPYFTNQPEDVVTNTWHFYSDGVTPFEDAATYLAERLQDTYQAVYTGLGGANWVTWANCTVQSYDLSTPEPRVPEITSIPITGNTTSTNANAPETSIVLSYQAVPSAGIPQARRRGRIYWGALGPSAISNGSSSTFPKPDTSWVTTMIAAVEANILDTGDAGLTWVVWSPTSLQSADVDNGWVDNAIDTQRRRGNKATARTLWP